MTSTDAGHGDVLGQPGFLDSLLAPGGMTLTELARRIDVTIANLSVLKNNRAKAIRFATLTAICTELGCEPGELLGLDRAEAEPAVGRS